VRDRDAVKGPVDNCMICDLYGVIDKYGDRSSEFVGGLVTVLPPRAHVMHNLAIWQLNYVSRPY